MDHHKVNKFNHNSWFIKLNKFFRSLRQKICIRTHLEACTSKKIYTFIYFHPNSLQINILSMTSIEDAAKKCPYQLPFVTNSRENKFSLPILIGLLRKSDWFSDKRLWCTHTVYLFYCQFRWKNAILDRICTIFISPIF